EIVSVTTTPAPPVQPAAYQPNPLVRFFYFIIRRSPFQSTTALAEQSFGDAQPDIQAASQQTMVNSKNGAANRIGPVDYAYLGFSFALILCSWHALHL